jgi:rhamnosyltransferase
MAKPGTDISIIIPARNEAANIGACLEAVMAQPCSRSREVIVIDSGSSDGTAEIVEKMPGVRLVRVDAGEFGHGRTRNLGAKLATGEFLVFLNADALPRGQDWLSGLVAGFAGDERIAGVYGRHVPRSGCHLYMARDLLRAMPEHRMEKTRAGRLDNFLFSTVSGAMRREIWQRYPFRDGIGIAEDQEWARRVLAAGYKLLYVPGSVVEHSHNYSFVEQFRIKYRVGRSLPLCASRVVTLLAGLFLAAGGMFFRFFGDCLFILRRRLPAARAVREIFISLGARAAGFAGRYAGWLRGPDRG